MLNPNFSFEALVRPPGQARFSRYPRHKILPTSRGVNPGHFEKFSARIFQASHSGGICYSLNPNSGLNKSRNNHAVVLMTALWALAVLSIIVFILGHQSRTELAFAKYRLAKARTKLNAWSWMVYVLEQFGKEGASAQIINRDSFKIGILDTASSDIAAGFIDETAKLNINSLTAENASTLKNLMMLVGMDEQAAGETALSVLDWKDQDSDPAGGAGAEDGYYMNLSHPYHCKNAPFDSLEELLLVKGVTAEVYAALQPYITVHPKTGNLQLNFLNADEMVIKALARAFAGPLTNADISDADSLTAKIIDFRDRAADNSDKVDMKDLKLNAKERSIYLTITPYRASDPRIVRLNIQGIDKQSSITTDVEAVIDIKDKKVLAWKQDNYN